MVTVRTTPSAVEIRPTLGEKVGGLIGDLTLPRAAIRSVEVVADGLAAARGLRAPGLALPGVVKIGTWRRRLGAKDYVIVRRGVPTLRLVLEGGDHARVLVSTPDAEALAAELGRAS